MAMSNDNFNMPEYMTGSFAAMKFGDDMSVQTLNPRKKKPVSLARLTASNVKINQESNYSLDMSIYVGGNEEEDMEFENLAGSNDDNEEMYTDQAKPTGVRVMKMFPRRADKAL